MRAVAVGSLPSVSATVSGASSALLAVVGCPACWPAYIALLSSLGLSVLADTAVLVPVTLVLLLVALAALAYRADRRGGWRPFAIGLVGAAGVLFGRLAVASDPVVLAGAGLLMAASIWKAWRRRATVCGECAATERELTERRETDDSRNEGRRENA